MNKEKLKELLFSNDRSKFDEALELNKAHHFYPTLNEHAEKLWQGIIDVKAIAGSSKMIVFSETLWDISLEEEDRLFCVLNFVELIQMIFPEYDDWPKVKKMAVIYLDIGYMNIIFLGD